MFERLKKCFVLPNFKALPAIMPDAVSRWAVAKGFAPAGLGAGTKNRNSFVLAGKTGNTTWKLERGKSTRDYIVGEELRARAELRLNNDVAVVIINRTLKEALEKRAYEIYTDTLQTTADLSLPEEMRWLAMYPEATWDGLPAKFWERYSVLAEKPKQAMAWLDPQFANLLMRLPEPVADEQVPFLLMILRGKAHLRMQYTPADVQTMEHAAKIFTHACESGLSRLSADVLI